MGAASRLRVSVTRHPTVLYHMVISLSGCHTDLLPAIEVKPNGGRQPLEIAGARHERTLFPVGWTPWLGQGWSREVACTNAAPPGPIPAQHCRRASDRRHDGYWDLATGQ